MEKSEKNYSKIEIIEKLTPLIIGGIIAGIAAFFTYLNDLRRIELSQIELIGRVGDLITSEKDSARAVGYSMLTAMKNEHLALNIIHTNKDIAGTSTTRVILENPNLPDSTRIYARDVLLELPLPSTTSTVKSERDVHILANAIRDRYGFKSQVSLDCIKAALNSHDDIQRLIALTGRATIENQNIGLEYEKNWLLNLLKGIKESPNYQSREQTLKLRALQAEVLSLTGATTTKDHQAK
ncbi:MULTISPECIES: hypothetical protein [unclassified Pseudomonas]|uniref:hypothetical protein n=1 Tax=unclassified Pseudomonas TaxID=196821 RepID=UPI00244719DC|nr:MULTISPECIES: hypothetical protein [unclassified Pseudomonas]MDG9930483.1 hypothetical protein [Pseudomonas sp. GD04042]MDH0483304.1 hypothetical protein [Pseudomonas sp. GD04015]MDH0606200.1 hypothetical protein [Pseudomonas sp. GD03869]